MYATSVPDADKRFALNIWCQICAEMPVAESLHELKSFSLLKEYVDQVIANFEESLTSSNPCVTWFSELTYSFPSSFGTKYHAFGLNLHNSYASLIFQVYETPDSHCNKSDFGDNVDICAFKFDWNMNLEGTSVGESILSYLPISCNEITRLIASMQHGQPIIGMNALSHAPFSGVTVANLASISRAENVSYICWEDGDEGNQVSSLGLDNGRNEGYVPSASQSDSLKL